MRELIEDARDELAELPEEKLEQSGSAKPSLAFFAVAPRIVKPPADLGRLARRREGQELFALVRLRA